MIINNNFKQLILNKSAETGKRITYKEISKATGITVSTLSRFALNPTYKLRAEYMLKLANYFSVSVDQLVVFQDTP